MITFVLISIVSPYSNFSYNSLVVDRKTKIYHEGQEFKHGPFTISVEKVAKPALYMPVNCSLLSNEKTSRLFPEYSERLRCEADNRQNEQISLAKQLIAIHLTIENNSRQIENFDKGWVVLITSDGAAYDLHPKFQMGNILPKSTRQGYFDDVLIDINEKEPKVVISIPNSASQIISLPIE
jgi:hypothetical protein